MKITRKFEELGGVKVTTLSPRVIKIGVKVLPDIILGIKEVQPEKVLLKTTTPRSVGMAKALLPKNLKKLVKDEGGVIEVDLKPLLGISTLKNITFTEGEVEIELN